MSSICGACVVRNEKQEASMVRFRYVAIRYLTAGVRSRGRVAARKEARMGLWMVMPLMAMDEDFSSS